ncbi:MAG: hypothetical protein ABH812_00730 [bacterium]
MTSKELIIKYFEGGNATGIRISREVKEILEVIKEMGDKLEKEGESGMNQFEDGFNDSDPRNSNK